jgi:hypothetical protein
MERIDPIEGLGFLGLTVTIYHGTSAIYEGLKNLMGILGGADDKIGYDDALALVSIYGYIAIQPQEKQERIARSLALLTLPGAIYALASGDEYWKGAKEDDKDKDDNAFGIAELEAKFYRFMVAMGAAYCIITFLKSYNWYQAVENVPGVNIVGTGVSQ